MFVCLPRQHRHRAGQQLAPPNTAAMLGDVTSSRCLQSSWVLSFSSMEMLYCALCSQTLFYGHVLASGGGWVLLFENCGRGSGQHNCLHHSDPELASRQPYRNTDGGCDDLPFAGGVSLLLLPEKVLAGLHSSYWLISPPTFTFSSLPSS